jgi:small-conductance mechanosensitive channel
MKSALAARSQAQTALDALLAETKDGKEPDGADLARFRIEVAENRVESLQAITEGLQSLSQLENIYVTAFKDRALLLHSSDEEQRKKALEGLNTISDRLKAWLNVVENDMTTCGAELSKLESRAASVTSDDPRFVLFNEQRAARSEMLANLQRASQAVETQRKIIRRWIADHTPKQDEQSLTTRLSSLGGKTWAAVKKIWSFEIMSFEDRIVVDGQTITGKIPLTLGMLVRALLFFCIGYWVSSRIANRIQNTIISRGHVAEHQARTLRNWAMIAVSVLLVLGTLSFLKIPLTVFAFFGGALAIGIGFGTQTLIKNFISGLIVLAERKVRVGDTLDVDGVVGTVVEVNTRSSIIRGADDVETMIPNSLFLENKVTNWTLSSRKVRRSMRVGVAYGTDPKTVMEILTESAGRHGLICKDPAPIAIFEDFGDNALIFSLYFWVELGPTVSAMVVTSDLRLMVDKRFNEAGIGIPFPQRDMHLTTSEPISVRIAGEPE